MPNGRHDTFGYNAVIAIGEHAVDRLVGAAFEQRDDSFGILIDDIFPSLMLTGSIHLWLRMRPSLDFDMDRRSSSVDRRRNIVLRFGRVIGRIFGAPPVVYNMFGGDEFEASIDVYCTLERVQHTNEVGELVTQLALVFDLTDDPIDEEDIVVRSLVYRDDPAELESNLRGAVLGLLQNADLRQQVLGNLSIPLNLDYPELRSTDDADVVIDYDVSVLDNLGPSHWLPFDEANMSIGAWEKLGESEHDESRGQVQDIRDTLDVGTSFAITLSEPSAERLIANALERRYMRFTLPPLPVIEPGGPSVEFVMQDHRLTLSRPIEDIHITGGVNANHRNLVVTVTNTRTSDHVEFTTDDQGRFETEIECDTGQPLDFHGDGIQVEAVMFPADHVRDWVWEFLAEEPTIGLAADSLAVSGILKHVIGEVEYEIYYEDNLYLRVDPDTGLINTSATTPQTVFPGYLFSQIMFATGHVFASFIWYPIAFNIFRTQLDKKLQPELEKSFEGPLENILPTIQDPESFRVFNEEIAITRSSIKISGQMESGRIKLTSDHEGRAAQRILLPNVDEVEIDVNNREIVTFRLIEGSGGSAVVCTIESHPRSLSDSPLDPANIWYLGRGNHDFERADVDSLRRYAHEGESAHVSGDSRSDISSVFFMERFGRSLNNACFGVRMPWGSYSKVRVRRYEREEVSGYAVRWVTFQPPPEPYVEIYGTLNRHKKMYSGNFRANVSQPVWLGRRIHTPTTEEGQPFYLWRLFVAGMVVLERGMSSETEDDSYPELVLPGVDYSGLSIRGNDSRWSSITLDVAPRLLPSTWLDSEGTFSMRLSAYVKDIFGRQATATRALTGRLI